MARELVEEGHSKGWNFVPVTLSSLAPTLVESELFGYVKGAFTGAVRDKVGLIGGGGKIVLFLDEIGELTPDLQVKLYLLATKGEYRRVGDTEVRKANVRIVAATSADLSELMATRRFKIDFFFRLAQKVIRVPPLRHRLEDVPLFLEHFFGEGAARFSPEALAAIAAYAWPGNLREFFSVLKSVLELNSGTIRARHILEEIEYRPAVPAPASSAEPPSLARLKDLTDKEKCRVILAGIEKGRDHASMRRETGYSDVGWVKLLIRLGLRDKRSEEG